MNNPILFLSAYQYNDIYKDSGIMIRVPIIESHRVEFLESKTRELEAQNEKLIKCVEFYADATSSLAKQLKK